LDLAGPFAALLDPQVRAAALNSIDTESSRGLRCMFEKDNSAEALAGHQLAKV